MAAAHRTDLWELIRRSVWRTLVQHHAEHLRDHVAGALDVHRIADAHVLAGDFVLIVQGGVGDHHAADGDRFELGDRRQRPGAADLDLDIAQNRGRLLGGEFMRDGPARAARHEAQPFLPVDAVNLVNDAVDVVIEHCTPPLDIAVKTQQHLD